MLVSYKLEKKSGVVFMASFEVGRVVVKILGREAGRRAVIVDIIDENFALISGPKDVSGVRRRRANFKHLEPVNKSIKIGKGASDEEIKAAIEEANLSDYMREVINL